MAVTAQTRRPDAGKRCVRPRGALAGGHAVRHLGAPTSALAGQAGAGEGVVEQSHPYRARTGEPAILAARTRWSSTVALALHHGIVF